MSVLAAAKKSRIEALRAMRNALAKEIDAGGGIVPQCVSQLRAVLVEIEEITGGKQSDERTTRKPAEKKTPTTPLSEFEERLASRQAAAKTSRKKSRSG